MRNNPLDDIVKCNIEISAPASNDATFNTILLVVAEPKKNKGKMKKTVSISTADELLDYGYEISSNAYDAATIAFSQNPAPSAIEVCVRGKAESGEVYEDIKLTLNRALEETRFYGIYLADFDENPEDVQATVEWTEAHEKIFGFDYANIASCPIKNFNYYRTFGMFSGLADGYDNGDQPKENKFSALALMAKCFGYDPGTETWHLKSLSTVVPSALSTDNKKTLKESHINAFLRYAGDNVSIGGYMLSGEWIDVIRFRDWLKNEMQVRVFNVLKVNRKVPYTDEGIGLIQGAMEATLARGQIIGGIAPTQYDKDDNPIPGYTVSVPRSTDLTEGERKSRNLRFCKYTARLAGAIHAVEIEGNLTF